MNICFVMYPWENIEPAFDTTLRLIHEACLRGHTIAITYPNKLTVRKSETFAFCKLLFVPEKPYKNVQTFYKKAIFEEKMIALNDFDAIVMRANPPLDNQALNFLDAISQTTLIVNSIDGIRKANNKLYSASFHDIQENLIPETHVSKNVEYLKKVIRESETDKMILKPLNGYGGKGIYLIDRSSSKNINSLLDFYINTSKHDSNYVILQNYVEGAEKGDVRVIMLNGKPIGAMQRVPAEDDVRSNIHSGGKEMKYPLSKAEIATCKKIGKRLVADGLNLVGLDFIGSSLIEINVLSPGGITRINKLNNTNLQTKVIKWLEKEAVSFNGGLKGKSII